MRRGLMSWSREELPVSVLDARLAGLQAAMREDQLGAVLAYTSFALPSAVHWICNFTPYWSEALLLVLPEGPPVLLASLTKRVHPWMREVSHLGEVLMAPRLGAGACDALAQRAAPGARVGVIGLDALPWSIAQPLLQAFPEGRLVDAGEMFARLRQPADAAEQALARQALVMAQQALDAAPANACQVSQQSSVIERSVRLAGAEELLQRVAPDLSKSAVLQRLEGDMPLGPRHAIELSVAYKGVWVRLARSLSAQPPASWAAAQAWWDAAATGLSRQASLALPPAPGRLVSWSLEACTGLQPLSTVAGSGMDLTVSLPPGSLAVFSAQLELDDGLWHGAAPLLWGGLGQDSRWLDA